MQTLTSEGTRANEAQASQEALALLKENATPELYRHNGFSVLELPADASSREINRRKQLVEMAVANEVPTPHGMARYFPIEPPPDEYAIRDAVQRLGAPERRLMDEFFWFWPEVQGESRSDDALTLLHQHDYEGASNIWAGKENSDGGHHVSIHNLAVLYHLLAIEWEKRSLGGQLTEEEAAQIKLYWTQAFSRWLKLLDDEGFWRRLTARVKEFEDPRLTAGTVRRIRSALPAALLSINAQLAIKALGFGHRNSAERLVSMSQGSGFSKDAVRDGLRQALEPTCERIGAICKAAERAVERDPQYADNACQELFTQAIPLLEALDVLLPAKDPTRELAHDDVAKQALRCQIAYAKQTDDWATSVTLLERAVHLACSLSVSKEITENLETVKKHADTNDDFRCIGYYDIVPEPLFSKMEEARKLVNARDYDGAVSVLQRLLAEALKARQELQARAIEKALAYCLGCRAVNVLNDAFDVFNAFEPGIIRTIIDRIKADRVDNLSFECAILGEIASWQTCRCMACGQVIVSRYTTITWTLGEKDFKFIVCGDCGDTYRNQMSSARSKLHQAIQTSARDYVWAGVLDPTNKFVETRIADARTRCTKYELPFPDAPKRRFRKALPSDPPPSMCLQVSGMLTFVLGVLGVLIGFLQVASEIAIPIGIFTLILGRQANKSAHAQNLPDGGVRDLILWGRALAGGGLAVLILRNIWSA